MGEDEAYLPIPPGRTYAIHPPSADRVTAVLARRGTVSGVSNEARPARLHVVTLPGGTFVLIVSNANSHYWGDARQQQLKAATGALGVFVLEVDIEIVLVS